MYKKKIFLPTIRLSISAIWPIGRTFCSGVYLLNFSLRCSIVFLVFLRALSSAAKYSSASTSSNILVDAADGFLRNCRTTGQIPVDECSVVLILRSISLTKYGPFRWWCRECRRKMCPRVDITLSQGFEAGLWVEMNTDWIFFLQKLCHRWEVNCVPLSLKILRRVPDSSKYLVIAQTIFSADIILSGYSFKYLVNRLRRTKIFESPALAAGNGPKKSTASISFPLRTKCECIGPFDMKLRRLHEWQSVHFSTYSHTSLYKPGQL